MQGMSLSPKATTAKKPATLHLRAHSISARGGGLRASQADETSWEQLPKFQDSRSMRDWWTKQQEAQNKRRQSQSPTPYEGGVVSNSIETPFPLDVLTSLLFDSPDLYAIVDQFATDVAGLGWTLIDSEKVSGVQEAPEQGEVDVRAAADEAAKQQRLLADDWLENIAGDINEKRIPLTSLFRCVIMDHESTGNGYIEVSTDPETKQPNGLFHVHARNVRKLRDGLGWVQLDDNSKAIAIFRDWNSDPLDQNSIVTRSESMEFSAMVEGELKNELWAWQRYHPGEANYGVPQVISALTAVYGNIYSDARNLRYFINRALPEWLVTIKADGETLEDENNRTVIDEYVAAIEEHLKYMIEGEDHRTLILELPIGDIEVTWERLSPEVKDQDFEVYQVRNRDIVMRVYRMLPHRVGIIETASLGTGTGETQEETYKRAQVDPRQNVLEDFIDELFIRKEWTLIEFKFNEIDVLDEAREMGLYVQAGSTKVMTINEMRTWLSRIVKDQDFPDYDDDRADIPIMFIEPELMAPVGFPGQPIVEPFGPAVEPAMTQLAAGPGWRTVDPTYANIARRVREGLQERLAADRERVMGAFGGRRTQPALARDSVTEAGAAIDPAHAPLAGGGAVAGRPAGSSANNGGG